MAKFHPIWKLYEGTFCTKWQSGQKLWKIAQGARMNGLSSSLVSMGDLSILITLPICSSNGIKNKALPLQISEKTETCIGSCAQFLIWWTWDKDGTSDYIARNSSTIYVGILSVIKIVVPLENGRIGILA